MADPVVCKLCLKSKGHWCHDADAELGVGHDFVPFERRPAEDPSEMDCMRDYARTQERTAASLRRILTEAQKEISLLQMHHHRDVGGHFLAGDVKRIAGLLDSARRAF